MNSKVTLGYACSHPLQISPT